MAKNFHKPTRMCVSCRQRFKQENLVRLHCVNSEVELYNGYGRSFYLCKICLEDEKRTLKALMRQCRTSNKDKLMIRLKEIITDDRKS
ncbi:MAG: hypothetical protein COB17_09265 [Sulfurimonas sp.]|nr:MAG: hypothetical protein COB17_09265 [Sulfurimonas sp.]